MDDLVLPRSLADEMIAYCQSEKPNEACGLLTRSGTQVVGVKKMRNAAASPVRYALDPKEQFDAYRDIEEDGLELGGVFHSHTRTPAYPSPTDVKRASEDVPYVIVSLATGTPSIRAYRILKQFWTDEEGEIEEIPVVIE